MHIIPIGIKLLSKYFLILGIYSLILRNHFLKKTTLVIIRNLFNNIGNEMNSEKLENGFLISDIRIINSRR